MKKLLSPLLAIFLLAGCATNPIKSNEAKKEIKPIDTFERNLECQKFREKLEKDFSGSETKINAIFYSPKTNSCLYNTVLVILSKEYSYVGWELLDVFTNKTIEYFDSPNTGGENTVSSLEKFKSKMEEYRN